MCVFLFLFKLFLYQDPRHTVPVHVHPLPHNLPTSHLFEPWYGQNIKWDVNSEKIGTKFIFFPPKYESAPTCLELGVGLRKRLSLLF